MPLQNGPTPVEKKDEKEARDFIVQSEDIRNLVDNPTSAEEWKQLLELVNHFPDLPDRPTRIQINAFRAVKEVQDINSRNLSSAVIFADKFEDKFGPEQKSKLFLRLAQYIEALRDYEASLGTPKDQRTSIPDFLKPFSPAEVNEKVVMQIANSVFKMQYDIADKVNETEVKEHISPRQTGEDAEVLLLDIIRKNVRAELVLKCLDKDLNLLPNNNAYDELLSDAGIPEPYTERNYVAAKFLAAYTAKCLKRIYKKNPEDEEKIQQLTVAELMIQTSSASTSIAVELVTDAAKEMDLSLLSFLQNRGVNMASFSERLMNDNSMGDEAVMEYMFKELRKEEEPDTDKDPMAQSDFKEDVQLLTTVFLSKNAQTYPVSLVLKQMKAVDKERATGSNTIDNSLAATLTEDDQREMFINLCESVQSKEFTKQLLGTTLLDESDPLYGQTEVILNKILGDGDIKVREAFDLYYLKKVDKFGGITSFMKLVDLLNQHKYVKESMDLQNRYFRSLSELVTLNPEELLNKLDDLGLTEEQKAEVRNIALHAKAEGLEGVSNALLRAESAFENWPEYLALFAAIVFRKQIYKGVKTAVFYNASVDVGQIRRIATMTESELFTHLKLDPTNPDHTNDIKRARAFQAEMKGIDSNLKDAGFKFAGVKSLLGETFQAAKKINPLNPRGGFNIDDAYRASPFGRKAKAIFEARIKLRTGEKLTDLPAVVTEFKSWGKPAAEYINVLAGIEPDPAKLESAMREAGVVESEITTALKALEAQAQSKPTAEQRQLTEAQQRIADLQRAMDALDAKIDAELATMPNIESLQQTLDTLKANRGTPEQRLETLRNLAKNGNVALGDISRIEAAIRTNQTIDFTIETNESTDSSGKASTTFNVKIK